MYFNYSKSTAISVIKGPLSGLGQFLTTEAL